MLFSGKLQPIVILATIVMLVSLVMAACSSAVPSSPSLSSSPAASSESAASTAPATKPAEDKAPASQPSAAPAWQAEWDKVLAAAKTEGRVVVGGAPGDSWRNAAMEFQKAYPDIKLEFTGVSGRDFGPKVMAERKAGLYLWDVRLGGAGSVYRDLIPNGAVAPFRAALILPEVLDDTKWHQGFDDGWTDAESRYIYAFLGYISYTAIVNRETAPESELKTLDDLADAKWRGKIAWDDPRAAGSGNQAAGNLLRVKGEDWLRKVLSNEIVPLSDSRMMLDGLVRGRFIAAIGTNQAYEEEYRAQGVLSSVKVLDPDSSAGAAMLSGFGAANWMDRSPHPNAAKVFLNWLLSRRGQEAHVQHTAIQSRRLDVTVQGNPETALRPGVRYDSIQKQKNEKSLTRAMEVAREVLR